MRIIQRPAVAIASAVALTLALAACGTNSIAMRTVTVTQRATTRDTLANLPADTASPLAKAVPTQGTTISNAFTRCDTDITAKTGTTTCRFAQNVFYAYWQDSTAPIRAYSPATGVTYRLTCDATAGRVICAAGDGAVVKFSAASVGRYTSANAREYAGRHDLGPASTPTVRARKTAPSNPAPAVVSPSPATETVTDDFCTTHDCIPNYPNGNGSTVQCSDGSFSHSGGIQGACSHHGGVG
jgi:hypothetical protein